MLLDLENRMAANLEAVGAALRRRPFLSLRRFAFLAATNGFPRCLGVSVSQWWFPIRPHSIVSISDWFRIAKRRGQFPIHA